MISVQLESVTSMSQNQCSNQVTITYCTDICKLQFQNSLMYLDHYVIKFQQFSYFSTGGEKAPGPDGFPMVFFQRFWKDIKEDLLAFIKEFHVRGKLSRHLGASFITLIPKKSGAVCIKDFRPISLIGCVYKILAKVSASGLQKVLPKLISLTQGAFVNGRQMLDGVLVANDCIHSRNLHKRPGLICKLDLEKAYDRVDWDFLHYLMGRMGLRNRWRG